jgi:hypothetical protein
MIVFDFPNLSPEAIDKATNSIRSGLDVALKHFPFLTGKLGLVRDRLELRYSSKAVSDPLDHVTFKTVVQEFDELWDTTWEDLCTRGMPVSHWAPAKLCASYPGIWKKHLWLPVFTLQANFLKSGGLVLCFAFQQTAADHKSICQFLEVFSKGSSGKEIAGCMMFLTLICTGKPLTSTCCRCQPRRSRAQP